MLPSRGTADNWELIFDWCVKSDDNFQGFYDMVRGVPVVKESCEDLEQPASSIANNDILARSGTRR